MKQSQLRPAIQELARDERGGVVVFLTIMLPVFVSLLALTVDIVYAYKTKNMLQVTAESAALAATAQLPDPVTSCAQAQDYANNKNFAASLNTCNDVVLGNWPQNCAANLNNPDGGCFVAKDCAVSPALCNSAKVTTRIAGKNFFAWALNLDVSATAIAVFGGNGIPWDMSIVQDVSGSFTGALQNARDADQALLTCLNNNAPFGSRLGITKFAGTVQTYVNPTTVMTNLNNLKTQITNLQGCGVGAGAPTCAGTDIGSAIKATADLYASSPNPIAGAGKSMVIVTDGLPNLCVGAGCNPQTYATAQADAAAALGISVYTIYYCSTGNCQQSAQDWLGGLVRGNGTALVTPDPTKLSTLIGQVCASQPHRLVF